ncbi:hypothetical protein INTERNEXUS_64 [Bacillus phage vB_BspM_Internexus]|nr:hypothetical protein INTERNEXUS_64 [Bacillus phage vB_BspM_Internexus]
MEKESIKDLLRLRVSKFSLENEFKKINEDDIENITNEIINNVDRTILTKHDFDHYLRNNVNPHIIDDIILNATKEYLNGYTVSDPKEYIFLLVISNMIKYHRDFDTSGIGYSEEQIEKNENEASLSSSLSIIDIKKIFGGKEDIEKHITFLMRTYGVSRNRIKYFSIN